MMPRRQGKSSAIDCTGTGGQARMGCVYRSRGKSIAPLRFVVFDFILYEVIEAPEFNDVWK